MANLANAAAEAAWSDGTREVPSPVEVLRRGLRVLQLDSSRLDAALTHTLQTQLLDVLRPVLGVGAGEVVNPAMSALIYLISVMPRDATYGQRLLGLKYTCAAGRRPSLWIKIAHFVLSVAGPFLWKRMVQTYLQRMAARGESESRNAVMAVTRIERMYTVISYTNFILFLLQGRFVNPVDRLLGLELSDTSEGPRRVTYDFLSRELLWHGFSEFAVFALPYVNLKSIRRVSRKLLGRDEDTGKGEETVQPQAPWRCVVCTVGERIPPILATGLLPMPLQCTKRAISLVTPMPIFVDFILTLSLYIRRLRHGLDM